LSLIEPSEMPDYPISRDERLPELAFIKWQPSRWLNSSGHLKCSYEVQGVARALFDLATAQSPIGTLPDDNDELAALLRMPATHFAALRGLGQLGPLRNWTRCLCPRGDAAPEIRLMHHVVTASLLDVLHRRETREMGRGERVEEKRKQRLRSGMLKAGFGAEQVADDVLMARIDEHLRKICTGNRMAQHYQAAFEHAVRQRWIE
jgi:hypothetical protein